MLLASCRTDHSVRAAAFSPFEADAFLTAGRDSVRCYRLRGGELRGMSVRRDAHGGPLGYGGGSSSGGGGGGGGDGSSDTEEPLQQQEQRQQQQQRPHQQQRRLPGTAPPGAATGSNVFTAIAFEAGAAAAHAGRRFAFVGSAAGVVFQVDCAR